MDKDSETRAKEIYSAGIQHYINISGKIQTQSDIIMYCTGFVNALIKDEKMKNEYLSITFEEMTKTFMKRIKDNK